MLYRVWCSVCGVWCVLRGLRRVACGVWCVACVVCVVCGVRGVCVMCVVCDVMSYVMCGV